MRFLLTIVILAALAWSGWWLYAARAREAALVGWLEARRADGWLAEARDIAVSGYPNRLDVTVTGLDLADPASGWTWSADTFQILSLSYRPNHVIAAWPGEQRVGTPQGTVTVTSDVLRGSVVFEPSTRLGLDRATIEIENLALAADDGWRAAVGTAVVAARRGGEGAPQFAYDLGVSGSDLTPPGGWTEQLDRTRLLPAAIGSVDLDAVLVFDRAWDRAAVEGENPSLEALRVRDVSLIWGELDLRGRGRLEADARGRAEGELELRARNWREMLQIAESSGALPGAAASALRTGLTLLATLGGDENSLTVPLVFADGRTRIGPVAIGEAPRLTRGR